MTAAEAASVSERTAYRWLRRWRGKSAAGLLDRSSAPKSIPRRTVGGRLRGRSDRPLGRALAWAQHWAIYRLGFSFEGVQDAHYIVKGRNRDTAWFRILTDEWPGVRQRLEDLLNAP